MNGDATGRAGSAGRLLAAAGPVICFVIGRLALDAARLGPVSEHMASHVLLMNVVAPSLALSAIVLPGERPEVSGATLMSAAVIQIMALWAAHIPGIFEAASLLPASHLMVQAALFGASVWFWLAVLAQRGAGRWRALVALLVTGKLFCLLGVLLVFSPRALYSGLATVHAHADTAGVAALVDQQRAGLLMLAACPLTYMLAAVVIAALWLKEMSARERTPGDPARPARLA